MIETAGLAVEPVEPELLEAERLLLAPTAANLERAAGQLAVLVDRARREERCRAAVLRERQRLAGLGQLLDSALTVRLGLERLARAGLAGYQADGRLAAQEEPGRTASVTG